MLSRCSIFHRRHWRCDGISLNGLYRHYVCQKCGREIWRKIFS